MTRSDLIKRIAKKHPELLFRDIEKAVDIIFSEITDSLTTASRIELRGFGSFSPRTRQPRKARNPKTNGVVQLRSRITPHFRAGKELREKLNNAL